MVKLVKTDPRKAAYNGLNEDFIAARIRPAAGPGPQDVVSVRSEVVPKPSIGFKNKAGRGVQPTLQLSLRQQKNFRVFR